ncbi:hypothetical protein B0H14DRAFT_3476791 [Mycena olivaceomarginata]|nr:hypothetical protein B0H14DRAFT_3476791 [Mycena olivaceomarginata]
MEDGQRENLEHLQSLAEDDDFNPGELPDFPNVVNMADVLGGSERIELSHAGGELGSLEDGIEEDCGGTDPSRRQADWRTRRDRTEIRNRQFLSQMPEMVSAYIRMCAEPEMPARPRSDDDAAMDDVYRIHVIDMFEATDVELTLDSRAKGIAPGLILHGVMPCAPWNPGVAIKIRVLETYRVMHVRCPHLAIQAFVKSLCDIHGVRTIPPVSVSTILYLVRLVSRQSAGARTTVWTAALGRDSSWRMKHACPACMYKLEGEDALIFEMLSTMDGNDSLKRVLRRDKSLHGPRRDRRADTGKRVDRWAKSRLGDRLPMEATNTDEDNPCAERWKNMINDVTSKMWGIFDETGIFLALCRHGFVLVIADNDQEWGAVRRSTLWRWWRSCWGRLGMGLGAGYNVGCHFQATVANSELGDEAWEKKLKCLVGSFHGHAHNRLCQLRFLATYVEGMGLEDLEGCERFFSRSNGLAKSCRYASRFHRQQEITTYAKHFDSLRRKFLCNNYRQALAILKTEPALRAWMRQEGVDGVKTFHKWLEEEKAYLLGLKAAAKTNTETLEMEYVQKLVNLGASQAKSLVVAAEARRARGDDGTYTPGVAKAELARRHAQEKTEKDLAQHRRSGWRLSPAIKQRKYQLALDALELLIVERIFELTKMNQSETGYKMRKHIAKALQARSKAVKNAIDRYNDAAALLEPPMPKLTWEEVVEYAFLADFDILRDTRAEVQSRPWTRPAYRLAMDRYFKTLRAREEIQRLNIEIQRVVTWIRDENRFLRRMEANLRDGTGKTEEDAETDTMMAVQLRLYRGRRGRFDAGHLRNFTKLAAEPGFTGSLKCGVAVERREVENRLRALQAELASTAPTDGVEVDGGAGERGAAMELDPGAAAAEAEEVAADARRRGPEMGEDDEGDDARDEAVSGLLYQISMLAMDGAPRGGEE